MQTQFDQWYNNLNARGGFLGGGFPPSQSRSTASPAAAQVVNEHNLSTFSSGNDTSRSNPSMIRRHSGNEFKQAPGSERGYLDQSDSNLRFSASASRLVLSNTQQGESLPLPTRADSFGPSVSNSQESDVNEDILAFYQAKEELMKRRRGDGVT